MPFKKITIVQESSVDRLGFKVTTAVDSTTRVFTATAINEFSVINGHVLTELTGFTVCLYQGGYCVGDRLVPVRLPELGSGHSHSPDDLIDWYRLCVLAVETVINRESTKVTAESSWYQADWTDWEGGTDDLDDKLFDE